MQTSEGHINGLLANLAAQKAAETGDPNAKACYDSAEHMRNTLDSIPYGDLPFSTFHLKYTGAITPETPEWKLKTYVVHTRNPLQVAKYMAGNPDFASSWDYVPFEEYTENRTTRHFCNLMSGTWANKKAVRYTSPSVYYGCLYLAGLLMQDVWADALLRQHSVRFRPITVLCSPLSYSVQTRLLSP